MAALGRRPVGLKLKLFIDHLLVGAAIGLVRDPQGTRTAPALRSSQVRNRRCKPKWTHLVTVCGGPRDGARGTCLACLQVVWTHVLRDQFNQRAGEDFAVMFKAYGQDGQPCVLGPNSASHDVGERKDACALHCAVSPRDI